jgi:hypothetical protein
MLFALLQEETTGIAGAAEDVVEQPVSVFNGLKEFGQSTYEYVTGAEFIGNVLASLLVVVLGIVVFRLLTRGVPRVLWWRRRSCSY